MPLAATFLSPDDRRLELAHLLARGLLRLRRRASDGAPCEPARDPKNLSESVPNCLEVPAETVLSGT